MTKTNAPNGQLGFLDLFDQHAREVATGHLPSDIESAIIRYREMLEQFNAALLAVDLKAAEQIYEEAHQLAIKLNGGTSLGIIADDNAPGCVLARETAAADGEIPLWGQDGCFTLRVCGVEVRIEMRGIFGIGMLLPGFSVNVVDYDRPFISETGYRSFLGMRAPPEPGMTTASWVSAILEAYIQSELKSKLCMVEARYDRRNAEKSVHPVENISSPDPG